MVLPVLGIPATVSNCNDSWFLYILVTFVYCSQPSRVYMLTDKCSH